MSQKANVSKTDMVHAIQSPANTLKNAIKHQYHTLTVKWSQISCNFYIREKN